MPSQLLAARGNDMAKFKAGDTIVSHTEQHGWSTLMVNKVFIETDKRRSFWFGKEVYSLDNGSGFIDARDLASNIDAVYELAD